MTQSVASAAGRELRDPLRLSIAIATYNGARYLDEQLRSLADQSRPPDEIVICDDRSTDATMEIVAAFARTVNFEVKAFRNEEQLGIRKNFAKAIGACTGDVIFMCDQDDVWTPQKLLAHERVYLQNPAVGLVFNNAQLVDADLKSLDKTTFQEFGVDERVIRELHGDLAVTALVRNSRVSGCTLSFRSWIWPHALPIPDQSLHDEWLVLTASILSAIHPISECFNLYRQHYGQAMGTLVAIDGGRVGDRKLTRQRWMTDQLIRTTLALAHFERLEAKGLTLRHARYREYLYGYLAHMWRRVSLSPSLARRLPICITEFALGNYSKYSDSVKNSLSFDLRPKYFS